MEQTNHPETRRLYDDNAYLNRFTANVLACTPAKKQGRFEVVLDQTAFFPEGGGQPADRGTLGGANVLDVQTRQGVITHLTDAPLEAGSAVEGVLDMEHRLDSMQQHSGEHILSGILHRMFGCENVGFHIGQEETTLDTSLPIPPRGAGRRRGRGQPHRLGRPAGAGRVPRPRGAGHPHLPQQKSH